MLSTEKGTNNFFSSRILRILPLYWLFTIATYIGALILPTIFNTIGTDFSMLIKSLICIPFTNDLGFLLPAYPIGWTINYEVFFYLIFLVSFKISYKHRGIICSLLLLSLSAIGLFISGDNTILYFWTRSVIVEFALGIAVFYLFKNAKLKSYKTATKLIFGGVAMISLAIAFAIPSQSDDVRIITYGILGSVVFMIFLFILSDVKFSGFLIRLGDASYSLYLVHFYIVVGFDRLIFNFSNVTLTTFLEYCLLLAVLWQAHFFYIILLKYQ